MNIDQKKRWDQCWEQARALIKRYADEMPAGMETPLNIEGVALAVAAVGAVSAGVSAYSSSQSKKDELDYQANNAPQFHSYDPVLAQSNPTAGLSTYFNTFNTYGQQAQQAADRGNSFYRQSIEALAPGTQKGVMLAARNANQELRGELPKDVAENIARASAQAGLTGGFSGSQMAGNRTARDFGLTSLQLRGQGASDLARNTTLAQALTPMTAAGLIGTPQQYQSEYDQYQQLNTSRQNEAAADAAGVQNRNAESNYFAGLAGVQGNAINPWGNAIASGAGSLSSYYTGGMLKGGGTMGAGTAAPVGTSNAGWNGGYYNPWMDTRNYDTTTGGYLGGSVTGGWG